MNYEFMRRAIAMAQAILERDAEAYSLGIECPEDNLTKSANEFVAFLETYKFDVNLSSKNNDND